MARPSKKPILDINADEDPDLPFSGGSSAAFINDKLNRPANKEKEEAAKKRSELLPVAEDILKHIADERSKVVSVQSFMFDKIDNPQDMLDELRARKMYLNYLQELQTWIVTRLSKTSR